MRDFIHNSKYIEKGVKCRGKKITYPKCLKVRFPNLDSSQTISALAHTSPEHKNIWMNFGLENSTLQHSGKLLFPPIFTASNLNKILIKTLSIHPYQQPETCYYPKTNFQRLPIHKYDLAYFLAM